MKKSLKQKVVISSLALSVFGSGVYAGTVVKTYKTPRGDFATVEKEEIHKNRISLEVDGGKVKKPTWYVDGTTYVPLRDAAEMLGAEVLYDPITMGAKITNKPQHTEQEIIKKSDLPYTLHSSLTGMTITIISISEINNTTAFKIKITNNGNRNAFLRASSWSFYADNMLVDYLGKDDYLDSFDYNGIKVGQTVEGEIYFDSLPSVNNSIILTPYVSNNYNDEKFTLHLDLDS
ncbi:hypothetical protein BTO30_13380 [Domibacillus antri]|uniref:Copper amine oxidase-like N-terminal domain-containing protein n=1 Tax=Domibacillus antri TaxID=1714264 RepID=A0A1Q8Q341_9BACI|nr:hypothetical protein [Domibacillus antri]OLN21691.1 hypothetical protein BTO30_13380 [Domibacillus antri]